MKLTIAEWDEYIKPDYMNQDFIVYIFEPGCCNDVEWEEVTQGELNPDNYASFSYGQIHRLPLRFFFKENFLNSQIQKVETYKNQIFVQLKDKLT